MKVGLISVEVLDGNVSHVIWNQGGSSEVWIPCSTGAASRFGDELRKIRAALQAAKALLTLPDDADGTVKRLSLGYLLDDLEVT